LMEPEGNKPSIIHCPIIYCICSRQSDSPRALSFKLCRVLRVSRTALASPIYQQCLRWASGRLLVSYLIRKSNYIYRAAQVGLGTTQIYHSFKLEMHAGVMVHRGSGITRPRATAHEPIIFTVITRLHYGRVTFAASRQFSPLAQISETVLSRSPSCQSFLY
jgi:hypothetical protein